MIFDTGLLGLMSVATVITGVAYTIAGTIKLENREIKDGVKYVLGGMLSLIFFGIFSTSFAEGRMEDNLYQEICTPEQQQARHITCQRGNIKVIYDDGDIIYEFLTPKVSDKNSSK